MRPTREETLMAMAFVMSHRSSCSRSQVGAILALGGRILSSGYNGTPAGLAHCNHDCDCNGVPGELPAGLMGHTLECLSVAPCTDAVHAEANAIVWAARFGVRVGSADLYTTMMPCLDCAKLIISAGIQRVLYAEPYRILDGSVLLRAAGVKLIRINT